MDDFLLQKFGLDSYEHVGRDVIPARVAALNKFKVEHKKFFFFFVRKTCLSFSRKIIFKYSYLIVTGPLGKV